MNEKHRILEEQSLRDAVGRGDERAWRLLYDRHYGPLWGYVHRRTGGRGDRTEDVIQECWMTAVRRMDRFDPARGPFAVWIRGIAANVLRNRFRAWAREARPEDTVIEPREPGPAPPERLALSERIGLAALALPEGYREVLRARYEEGLGMAEIARDRGRSVKAVESLLGRARRAFREAFARLDRDEPAFAGPDVSDADVSDADASESDPTGTSCSEPDPLEPDLLEPERT